MHPPAEPFWQDQLAESLIESINVWVNVCDSQLNILVMNPTAERICGYSTSEVVGHARIWEWLYPDVERRQEVYALTAHVLREDGHLRGVETDIVCKNGDIKTIAWYSRPLVKAHTVLGFVTFGYDATDKKLAERALQKAHNELHVLYEIASITNEVSNLNLILERSLERILSVMKSSGGTMHLWDNELGKLNPVVASGIEPECYPDIEFVSDIYRRAQNPLAAKYLSQSGDSMGKSRTFLGVAMRAKGQIYGVISILVDAGVQISQDDLALLNSIADQIGIAVENARLYRQSQHLAVAEERRRLARDLHDSVTQSLYSLTLFAEAGHRLLHSGEIERVEKYLERLNQTAQDALKEMRLLLYELRPWALESGKLVETIQHRLDAVERRSGLTAHLITTQLPPLPPRFEDNLYHIMLESLNNSLKHAFASAVTIQLCADEHSIRLDIIDNGTGFDHAAALQTGGMGLTNMRERAEELGGTFTIDSSKSAGTTVRACIPFHA
jgi:PAS domain S-box-containing protein